MKSQTLPEAREEGLIVEELQDELLVYDLERHKAHCLKGTTALIWRDCDGRTSVREITARLRKALKTPIDEDIVWVALHRLGKANLLQKRVTLPKEIAASSSRRDMMKKVAALGGISVISLVVPTAADAASRVVSCKHAFHNGLPENGQCCSNGLTCHFPARPGFSIPDCADPCSTG